MLKVSIITVCYNSEKFIADAINSVLSQTYKNIEYIVVDGASTDRTVSIVKSYGDRIYTFISEPDKGIYDAMNKGLQAATGDILGILNSDDLFMHHGVITSVVNAFETHNTDSIFADLIYVKNEDANKQVRYWKSSRYKTKAFQKGWHPAHPTFYVKRGIYQKFGYFDLSFKLAADFELMLRFLEKHNISSFYLNEPLVKMRLGGATNKNFSNIKKQNIECIKAFKKNGLSVSFLYPVYRLAPKLLQFFK